LPDKNTSNGALYELYITSNLWVAFLENAASEQSARMTAMENASKNAGEIVDKLTLQYNKARQARITMELVEIISLNLSISLSGGKETNQDSPSNGE